MAFTLKCLSAVLFYKQTTAKKDKGDWLGVWLFPQVAQGQQEISGP